MIVRVSPVATDCVGAVLSVAEKDGVSDGDTLLLGVGLVVGEMEEVTTALRVCEVAVEVTCIRVAKPVADSVAVLLTVAEGVWQAVGDASIEELGKSVMDAESRALPDGAEVIVGARALLVLARCKTLCEGLAAPGCVSVLLSVAVSLALAGKEGTCAALDDRSRLAVGFRLAVHVLLCVRDMEDGWVREPVPLGVVVAAALALHDGVALTD